MHIPSSVVAYAGRPVYADVVDTAPAGPRADEVVRRLIDGEPLPPDIESGLAAAYVVTLIRPAGNEAVAGIFPWRGTQSLVAPAPRGARGDLVALVRARADGNAEQAVRELRGVRAPVWCAVASRPRAEIPAGYREATHVLALAGAVGSEPGVYGRDDFLLEYAVTRDDTVADRLTSIISPLEAHGVLWATMAALVQADHNRSRAAKDLFIHRSTLDYRLRQIGKLTGHDPMTSRGAQLLATAMAITALRDSRES